MIRTNHLSDLGFLEESVPIEQSDKPVELEERREDQFVNFETSPRFQVQHFQSAIPDYKLNSLRPALLSLPKQAGAKCFFISGSKKLDQGRQCLSCDHQAL